ncbi:MAG: substrate-binding domain-containing protein [Clostridia bacterium]|nr:substrate-binding domain-containing protein [Clostridia bacterium]
MKKVLALVLCLLMVFAVTASAKEISEVKIGYILKPESNEYWSSMKEGVLKWAEEKGVQVDVQCVDDESNFTGQLEMMENMINMGYDAICAAPLSANNLVSGAVKAAQAGVVVVNVDENIDLEAVIAEGGNMAGHYTTDNIIVGNTGAQFIVDKIGEGQVAIISGTDGNVTSNNRVAGATEIFEATEGVELVAVQNGDWDRMVAMDAATNIMTTYPDLKAFYCANDTMALGVYEAVVNAGKADQVIVVGTDAVQGAKESVRDGQMAATVGQDNIGIGIACGELALQCVLDGWTADPTQEQCVTQYISCFLVTAENAADYL